MTAEGVGQLGHRSRMLYGVLLLFLHGISYFKAEGWSYNGAEGPDSWPTYYPNCAGQNQSPIDIDSAAATYAQGLDLTFTQYNTPNTGTFTVTNNGHSVQVTVPKNSGITITHGLLPYTYTLEQFHFHWGNDDTHGSEHSVDGKFSQMEIHFVHFNSDQFSDVASAANSPRGLAVLAIFVNVNAAEAPLREIDDLINHFPEISYEGNTTTMPSFSIDSLLPKKFDYYRYSGSLTTPPCYESVFWSVFTTTIAFTAQQMQAFRSSLYSNVAGYPNAQLVNNIRPVQPLNGRSVFKSVP